MDSVAEPGPSNKNDLPVVTFRLPSGAGQTLTNIVKGLHDHDHERGVMFRVIGISVAGWVTGEWEYYDRPGVKQVRDGVLQYGPPVEQAAIMHMSWRNRGDGWGGVQLAPTREWAETPQFERFAWLLTEITRIWPETIPEIDRALGLVEEAEQVDGYDGNEGQATDYYALAVRAGLSLKDAGQYAEYMRIKPGASDASVAEILGLDRRTLGYRKAGWRKIAPQLPGLRK